MCNVHYHVIVKCTCSRACFQATLAASCARVTWSNVAKRLTWWRHRVTLTEGVAIRSASFVSVKTEVCSLCEVQFSFLWIELRRTTWHIFRLFHVYRTILQRSTAVVLTASWRWRHWRQTITGVVIRPGTVAVYPGASVTVTSATRYDVCVMYTYTWPLLWRRMQNAIHDCTILFTEDSAPY